MTHRSKVSLCVEAIFSTDGRLRPIGLFAAGRHYDIDRVLSICRRKPVGVPCIAPTEYKVVVCGVEKAIYYEPDTGTWFSVKETVR